ncbi:MAG: flagellar protein FlaG [Candidatus Krumholzibacteriia bacterium]
MILIKDAQGEVIKQFPPEKILNLNQKMDDLVGIIIDEAT